jgi:N-acetyl sugar amidotransferase
MHADETRSTRPYQICTRCIMDTTDTAITFDGEGVCNHCRAYDERARRELFSEEWSRKKLEATVSEIKAAGRNRDYDCLIGVSGGVDSSMVAYMVKQLGLRALAVHVDNGWNSELAVNNIEFSMKKLGIDLHTIVLDWEEFRDLQLAFLRSSIANIEIPTDHVLPSLMFRTASEHGIRYILSGSNVVSEAIMPSSWMHDSRDLGLIKAIQRRFGSRPLRTYPACSMSRYAYYVTIRKIKYIPILNYVKYNKKAAKELIQRELGWRDYGGKHYESVFTRFFQGYILPVKFNMDKRLPHLSSLICSGQMSRDEALKEMKEPAYPQTLFRTDFELFLKKMRLTEKEFEAIMNTPPVPSTEYANSFFARNRDWIIPIVKKVVKPKSLKSPRADLSDASSRS